MGKLTTIVIERVSNGYVVEDFFNTKTFEATEEGAVRKVQKILKEWKATMG